MVVRVLLLINPFMTTSLVVPQASRNRPFSISGTANPIRRGATVLAATLPATDSPLPLPHSTPRCVSNMVSVEWSPLPVTSWVVVRRVVFVSGEVGTVLACRICRVVWMVLVAATVVTPLIIQEPQPLGMRLKLTLGTLRELARLSSRVRSLQGLMVMTWMLPAYVPIALFMLATALLSFMLTMTSLMTSEFLCVTECISVGFAIWWRQAGPLLPPS